MSEILAAVDLGTTSVRCCLFETNGNCLAAAGKEYPTAYPFPGAVEQDLSRMTDDTFDVCRQAMAAGEIDPVRVKAVSFSTQRSCFCPVDRKGAIIRPMISWQDSRTARQVERMSQAISNEDFTARTGLPLSTVNLLPKLLWMQENEPEEYAKIDKIVQCQDVLLHAFGVDDWITDRSCAAFYGCWNVGQKSWDPLLLDLFQLTESRFGRPELSGQVVGTIPRHVADKTGFAEGTPICLGAGDQNCSVLGMGAVRSGQVTITLGTAGLVILSTENPRCDLPGMFCTNHIVPDLWNLEGLSNAAASSLRWYRDAFVTQIADETKVGNVWSYFEQCATSVPPGANGLLFLPYLAAAAAPHWNPDARGCLLGLALSHGQGDVLRAIMEGVVFEVNEMLQVWRGRGIALDAIRLGGGATRSKLWNSIQADVYNCPVEIVREQETAALGAALLAGYGVGLFSSLAEGVDAMVHADQRIEPNAANQACYQERFELFQQSYHALNNGQIFSRLAASTQTKNT
ncbi:MAG: FGGY family carbohydrate kinase [Planctomycetia bacterium]|nr:FGGY family carbohydrate kinase [Planctomycetia bacterium]